MVRDGGARADSRESEAASLPELSDTDWPRKRGVNDRPRFASPFHGWSGGGIDAVKEIGNYRLLDKIGSGNFGTVFLAEHKHLQEKVALKLLRFNGSNDTLIALTRAARYLSALDHRHIVKLRDFGAVDEYAYLVMDLITPGVAIDLMAARMPLKATIETLGQLARALEYCHDAEFSEGGVKHKGICHGDIKPANILMGNDRAYLTDFMLPNMEEFQRRDHGHPCFPYYDTRWYGTPMYMAPEQLRGVVNTQTDIFAFGVTSYELLTGKYPWNAEEEFSARFDGTPIAPPTVLSHNKDVPGEVSELIQRTLSFHPGDRPRSFCEVARTFRSALSRFNTKQVTNAEQSGQRIYDVALSFAGTDRELADQIYQQLQHHCRVFYDKAPQPKVNLWGSDLSTYLHEVYANQATYCLVLISHEYVERAWTNWERRAILQRMVDSKTGEYVLPVLIDNVTLPGLPTTIGALTLHEVGVQGIVEAVIQKVKGSPLIVFCDTK